jgi:hypothetical protein
MKYIYKDVKPPLTILLVISRYARKTEENLNGNFALR